MKTPQQQSREKINIREKISTLEVVISEGLFLQGQSYLGQIVYLCSDLLVEIKDHLSEDQSSWIVSFEHSVSESPELHFLPFAFLNEFRNIFYRADRLEHIDAFL